MFDNLPSASSHTLSFTGSIIFMIVLFIGVFLLFHIFKFLNSYEAREDYNSESFNHELKSFPDAYEIAKTLFVTGNINADAQKLSVIITRKYNKEPSFKFCLFVMSEMEVSK